MTKHARTTLVPHAIIRHAGDKEGSMADNVSSKSMAIDAVLLQKIQRSVKAALDYERATNGSRKLGITGEVGEVLICHQMGLRSTIVISSYAP